MPQVLFKVDLTKPMSEQEIVGYNRTIDMPLYDFKCETCGIFDKWRPLAEADPPVLCPSCETVAKRIFSPPIILTGKLRLKGQENREPQVIKRPANRQDACSTIKFTLCGTGILPVLDNGARCELKPTFAIRQGVKSLAGQGSILYLFFCQYNIIIN